MRVSTSMLLISSQTKISLMVSTASCKYPIRQGEASLFFIVLTAFQGSDQRFTYPHFLHCHHRVA